MNRFRNIIAPIAVAAILAAVIIGCTKKDEIQTPKRVPTEVNADDVTENLVFFNQINGNLKEQNSGVDILVIKLHRKSMGCDKKLGICEIWFLGTQLYKSTIDTLLPSREIYYTLEHDEKSDKLLLLLATDVSGIDSSELKLFVDEDICCYDETMTKSVTVPQGIYHYDQNLGEFGGYSVNYSFCKAQ